MHPTSAFYHIDVPESVGPEFLQTVTALQAAAEAALIRGDAGPRIELWSHRNPVSLFAAVGPSVIGWSQLANTLPSVAARLKDGTDVRFEVVAHEVHGDIGWTAGFSRFAVSMDGQPVRDYVLRVTQIYRREGAEWKMTHEHSNFEPA